MSTFIRKDKRREEYVIHYYHICYGQDCCYIILLILNKGVDIFTRWRIWSHRYFFHFIKISFFTNQQLTTDSLLFTHFARLEIFTISQVPAVHVVSALAIIHHTKVFVTEAWEVFCLQVAQNGTFGARVQISIHSMDLGLKFCKNSTVEQFVPS